MGTHFERRKKRTLDEWHKIKTRGSCYRQPWLTKLFFPGQGESQREAMDICHGSELQDACPILQECLVMHLEEPFGIWGGTSERERRKMAVEYRRSGTVPTARRNTPGRRKIA